jgi:hypothetical protein
MKKIKLGDMAKDTITGFTGVVTAITDNLSNCRRYGLQPRETKDGKPIDSRFFDEVQIERTGATNIPVVAVMHPFKGKPGATVRDRVTGLEGVVTAVTTWIGGCVRMTVQPKDLKDGVPVDPTWIDSQDAEIIEPAARVPKVAHGGPMPAPRRRDGR